MKFEGNSVTKLPPKSSPGRLYFFCNLSIDLFTKFNDKNSPQKWHSRRLNFPNKSLLKFQRKFNDKSSPQK